MKKNKGFTLIELLAVIVILAIIMVIAVPQILNIIDSSRTSAWTDSVKMVKNAIQVNTNIVEPSTREYKYTVKGLCNNETSTDKDTTNKLGEIVDVGDMNIDCKKDTNYIFTLKGKNQFNGKRATITCTIDGNCDIDILADSNESSNSSNVDLDNLICKKASSLNTNGSITYGQIPTGNTFHVGDAFDCKVSTSGDYTERFYYVSDYYDTSTNSFNSNYAVLIYSYNTINGTKNTENNTVYGGSDGPSTLASNMPSNSQWDNISLYKTTRNILDQNGQVKAANYSYSSKSARILTYQEILSACNNCNAMSNNAYNGLDFLFENLTNYGPYPGIWLETLNTGTIDGTAYLLYGAEKRLSLSYVYLGDRHTPRPVIEIEKQYIEH